MAQNEKPAERGLNGLSSVQSFGGCERPEVSPAEVAAQESARDHERIARRHALAALLLAGSLALQQAAISTYYAQRAVRQMRRAAEG